MYQTNGACHDFCWNDYALAITQYDSCWCSNYLPDKGDQVDLSECDTKCIVPIEDCGGPDLFGYLILGTNDISGTVGGSSPSTTTKAPPTVSILQALHQLPTIVSTVPPMGGKCLCLKYL